MHIAILIVSVIAILSASPRQADSNLDKRQDTPFRVTNPRLSAPCGIAMATNQIARKANVLVGVENTPGCRDAARSREAREYGIDLQGATAREALNQLVEIVPDYEWREVDGVAVIRPKGAWDDPKNILNLPAAPFNVSIRELWDVLDAAVLSVTPQLVPPRHTWRASGRPIDMPVSISFRGGTLLEALNEVIRPRPGEWELSYDQDRSGAHIWVNTLEFSGGTVMTRFAVPVANR